MRLLGAILLAFSASAGAAQVITTAEFLEPTQRYGHAVLGDDIEWGALSVTVSNRTGAATIATDAVVREEKMIYRLPLDHVFEDVSPRLVDVTGDGLPEVVVVETDMAQGAALAVYGVNGKTAETPHIGQSNRWLAPIGAADLDGDGTIEIAYIDRPHLAKTLRIWRLEGRKMVPVAALEGYTNHRIGERDIAGGMRVCAGTPEMIVATADWARVVAVRFGAQGFAIRDIGPHRGRSSFRAAQTCD